MSLTPVADTAASRPTTMTVAALANRVGIKPDTVRYYERIGLLPPPERTAADHRRYDESAVDLLRFVQGAQRLGLRLAEIRQLLALRNTGECPCGPAADLLHRRLDELDEQIARLVALRSELRRFVARLPADDCPEPYPGTWRPREEVTA
jgi:DNA-binding transcriptional MerR regulator